MERGDIVMRLGYDEAHPSHQDPDVVKFFVVHSNLKHLNCQHIGNIEYQDGEFDLKWVGFGSKGPEKDVLDWRSSGLITDEIGDALAQTADDVLADSEARIQGRKNHVYGLMRRAEKRVHASLRL